MNEENYKGKTCKQLGWKEGDTFKMSVNMDKENFRDYGLSVGDVVTLVEDDNSCLPIYKDKQGDDICLYDYEVEKIVEPTPEIKKLQEEHAAQTSSLTLSGVATSIADLRNTNPTEFDAMVKGCVIGAAEDIGVENAVKAITKIHTPYICPLQSLLKDFHKGHDISVVITREGYSLEFDNYTFTDLTLEKLTDKLELFNKLFPNE